MKVLLCDVDKLVKINELKEITTPVYFEYQGVPTSDGLFSFEIFGRPGSINRKVTWAYINLEDKYIHPIVYKSLLRINRNFEKCISCVNNCKFIVNKNGELEEVGEDDPKGGAGLKWLYNHWDELKFKKNASEDRKQRIDLIKGVDKDVIWSSKLLVIPPFYRDLNFEKLNINVVSRDEINEKYTRILRLLSNSKFNLNFDMNDDSDDPMINSSKLQIQYILNDIYDYCTGKLKGKTGIFRNGILSKTVDYAGITVITAPRVNCNRYTEMRSDFYHTAVPLYETCNLFYPFIIKYINDYVNRNIIEKGYFLINSGKYDENGKPIPKKLLVNSNKTLDLFTDNEIYRRLKSFEKSPNSRYDPVKVYVEEEKGKPILKALVFHGFGVNKHTNKVTKIDRILTWTDLLYMAAYETVKDKHLYITRYPINTQLSCYTTRINVNSILDTYDYLYLNPDGLEKLDESLMEKIEAYPMIKEEDIKDPSKIGSKFIDTLVPFSGHLKAVGGDFDGDTFGIRAVYTQEANEEAERFMKASNNILVCKGENIRATEKNALQTIFDLTK